MATKKKISTSTKRKSVRKKGQDKKSILIAALVVAISLMSVGYAAFATTLNINGNSTITGSWDVEIIGISGNFTGTAKDKTAPAFTATTATFDADLNAPGDKATYTIEVKNKGTIDASLSQIVLAPQSTDTGSSAIIYTIDQQPAANDVLAAGETTTVVISAQYDPTVTNLPAVKARSFTGTLIYEQAAM